MTTIMPSPRFGSIPHRPTNGVSGSTNLGEEWMNGLRHAPCSAYPVKPRMQRFSPGVVPISFEGYRLLEGSWVAFGIRDIAAGDMKFEGWPTDLNRCQRGVWDVVLVHTFPRGGDLDTRW